jgi:hypothetical protein
MNTIYKFSKEFQEASENSYFWNSYKSSDNKIHYFNSITQESSYEKPQNFKDENTPKIRKIIEK